MLGVSGRSHTYDTSGVLDAAPGVTASIRSLVPNAPNATLIKSVAATGLRLKRVRLSGSIRTTNVTSGSLWLRIDGPNGMLVLDNGMDRGLRGTQDWTDFAVALPVSNSASRVIFGLLLSGGGEMEVRNLRFEEVGVIDTTAPMHPEVKLLVDSAIAVARTRSVWRDTLSWDRIVPEVYSMAVGAGSAAEAFPAIHFLARRLGDRHSGFLPPTTARAFQTGGSQNPAPTVKPLTGRVGYVSVPAYSGGEVTAMTNYSNALHTELLALLPSASCGWVIDLRKNGGGNMYPMLAGLRPFLGEETLGYFVSGKSKAPWSATRSQAPKHPSQLDALGDAYVAVLTGPRTASSGEIVAISFRGRDRTRSFGLPTGGYSTANSMIPLPGGARFNITTAIDADRSGKEFGHAVDPDERVESPDPARDVVLERATEWLSRESRCSATTSSN